MDKSGMLANLQDQTGIQPDVGAKMLVQLIDGATRETHGGEFTNIDGSKIPW
jgi:hypothetical protein